MLYQGSKKTPAKIKRQRNKLIVNKLAKNMKIYHKGLANFLTKLSNM